MALFSARLKNPGVFLRLNQKVIRDVNEILKGTELLNEVGEFATDRIRYQARVTKPFNNSGDFPDLQPTTITNRRYLAKYNQTHATYQDNRSNLTITGQLLGSLKHFIRGTGLIEINFDGNHTGYKTGSGRTKSLPNKKIAEYLREKKPNSFVAFDGNSLNNNKTFKARISSIVRRFIRRGLSVRRRLST